VFVFSPVGCSVSYPSVLHPQGHSKVEVMMPASVRRLPCAAQFELVVDNLNKGKHVDVHNMSALVSVSFSLTFAQVTNIIQFLSSAVNWHAF
jgi:hypothetical protein